MTNVDSEASLICTCTCRGIIQLSDFFKRNISFQAGALLACGIVNVGVRNECDPALALLSDYVLHASSSMRLGAVIG